MSEVNIEEIIKRWELMDEVKCNHCGVIFKGGHDCNYEELKKLNARLREALEFYADFYRYNYGGSIILQDAGEKARQALKGPSDET